MFLSPTILPSLVIIVKRNLEIWTKMLESRENFYPSLWLGLDGELLVEVSFILIRKEIAT